MDLLTKISTCARYIGSKMKQYQNLIGLILTLIMFIIRFIPTHNEVLETRPPRPPKTIASNGSKVLDIWDGSLLIHDIALLDSEIAMVYYYAPWSAESLDGFREFEEAAEVMYTQVSFIAVNCWLTHGECRGRHQFPRYPQSYLNHRILKQSIRYNGPWKKEYYLDFIQKGMFPIEYLGSKEKVRKFLSENQFTALAFFEPSNLDFSKAFKNYSSIAYKQLGEYKNPIRFGVVTNVEISNLHFLKPNIIQVRNRLSPKSVTIFNLKSSVEVIFKKLIKIGQDVICPDLKFPTTRTNFLYQTIKKGPTAIVFISSNQIEKRERYVSQIRRAAILYNDCHELESNDSHPSSALYARLAEGNCCKTVVFEDEDTLSMMCSICVKWDDTSASQENYGICDLMTDFIRDVDYDQDSWIHTAKATVAENLEAMACASVLLGYDRRRGYFDICCKEREAFFKESNRTRSSDKHALWMDELLKKTRSSEANRGDISELSDIKKPLIFASDSVITGLACKTNRSLQFLTLDFDMHNALSINLGVDKKVYDINGSKMAAAIFDPLNEKKHAMSSSQFDLENFIINYTLGILPSHLRSSKETSNEIVPKPCVLEITTKSFVEKVLNSDKDILLLYYTPWCIACTSVSHIYLSFADLLHPVSTVRLARINAQENDLPLPFAVQSYPTVILFPGKKSSYSSVFPKYKEFSVSNLLAFLFNNTSRKSAKQILFNICVYASDYPSIQHKACEKWKSITRL